MMVAPLLCRRLFPNGCRVMDGRKEKENHESRFYRLKTLSPRDPDNGRARCQSGTRNKKKRG
jgi:hypothetical protein